ncbi:MAG: hypothetical protein ACP5I2_04610 [Fervidicoccaceae archaeon]|uniref:Uncharacterized protein n=1 Tax=Fervidicoccus fontis TaxID=683846 RepID=A0A7C2YJL5_9CREN|nr:MAG: hypothetical protein C0179_02695 [Fervidicoccus sp.]HEU97711.1 hypothetical protein [Fervidicoccus fontis]
MAISEPIGHDGGENSEVLERFRAMLTKEANETRKEAISTAKLAITIYKSGEKELALLVIRESMRIAKSYIELAEKVGENDDKAYDLLVGIETIEELIKNNEKADYLRGILEEIS